jgi:hypothetical protein
VSTSLALPDALRNAQWFLPRRDFTTRTATPYLQSTCHAWLPLHERIGRISKPSKRRSLPLPWTDCRTSIFLLPDQIVPYTSPSIIPSVSRGRSDEFHNHGGRKPCNFACLATDTLRVSPLRASLWPQFTNARCTWLLGYSSEALHYTHLFHAVASLQGALLVSHASEAAREGP